MRIRRRGSPPPHLVVFVDGGNTCRSAMAEAIARKELQAAGAANQWRVLSAGTGVSPDAPIRREAAAALQDLGVRVKRHRAQPLTLEMIREADAVYCMTAVQCELVHAIAPDAAAKVVRFDPAADLPDPIGQPHAGYLRTAQRVRALVRRRLADLGAGQPIAAPGA